MPVLFSAPSSCSNAYNVQVDFHDAKCLKLFPSCFQVSEVGDCRELAFVIEAALRKHSCAQLEGQNFRGVGAWVRLLVRLFTVEVHRARHKRCSVPFC